MKKQIGFLLENGKFFLAQIENLPRNTLAKTLKVVVSSQPTRAKKAVQGNENYNCYGEKEREHINAEKLLHHCKLRRSVFLDFRELLRAEGVIEIVGVGIGTGIEIGVDFIVEVCAPLGKFYWRGIAEWGS